MSDHPDFIELFGVVWGLHISFKAQESWEWGDREGGRKQRGRKESNPLEKIASDFFFFFMLCEAE